MAEVYLDGEKVDFQGDAPATLAAAWAAVEGYLGSVERVLEEALVDGAPVSAEQAQGMGSYARAEFRSASFAAKLSSLCEEWVGQCSETLDAIGRLSASALRSPWSESQASCVACLESLRPQVEGFGMLENFGRQRGADWSGEVSARYAAAAKAVDRVVGAVESRDCVALSDRLALDLAPRWEALVGSVSAKTLPALRKEASDG